MPISPAVKCGAVCTACGYAWGSGRRHSQYFNVPDRKTAETHLREKVKKYADLAPKLSDWMEVNLPEGFTVFSFPKAHQGRLRISNFMERLSQEIKQHTRVVRVFPNENSCLRLVSAILMETSEEWEFGRIYLNMEDY